MHQLENTVNSILSLQGLLSRKGNTRVTELSTLERNESLMSSLCVVSRLPTGGSHFFRVHFNASYLQVLFKESQNWLLSPPLTIPNKMANVGLSARGEVLPFFLFPPLIPRHRIPKTYTAPGS